MNRCASRRIAILTPTFQGHDGISSVARGIVTAIAQVEQYAGKIDVLCLCDQQSSSCLDPDDTVTLHSAAGSKIRFVTCCLQHALTRPYELVVVNHLSLLPSAMALRSRTGRVAVFLHGVECWRPLGRLRTWCLRNANIRLANSHFTWQGLIQHNHALTNLPVSICPLGVADTDRAHRLDVRPPGDPEQYALIVGRMASDEQYKGHDQLIDLWPQLLEQVPGAALMIAGTGDDAARLQGRVQAAGLHKVIRFLGRVDDHQLERLYQGAAFFAMPSTGERRSYFRSIGQVENLRFFETNFFSLLGASPQTPEVF